jgi:hypothetical protein
VAAVVAARKARVRVLGRNMMEYGVEVALGVWSSIANDEYDCVILTELWEQSL